MSELPSEPERAAEEPNRLDPNLRLFTILSTECNIEPNGAEQWNQLDLWRSQRGQLMHELTWIGIAQDDSLGRKAEVAKSHDRRELTEALLDLFAHNRFNPTQGLEIRHDHQAIQRDCKIQIGHLYWSMREPFIEYWQGRYRPDAARRKLLQRVIEMEKQKQDKWPLEERAWQWIEAYFQGCCPQEVDMPEHQSPDAVLRLLENDFELVQQLPLSTEDLQEVCRILQLEFLRGEYPLIVEEDATDAEAALTDALRELAEAPREFFGQMDLRATAIASVLQRYRKYLALDLDFQEEEERRIAESAMQDELLRRDHERRQREYNVEDEFLRSLELPAYEAQNWPELLSRIANSTFFHPAEQYRERIHEYVRQLIILAGDDEDSDVWSLIGSVLQSFWNGNFYPDELRWGILQNECAKAGGEENPRGAILSEEELHSKFVRGSSKESPRKIAKQDLEMVQIAYGRDMQMIRGLELSEEEVRQIEWLYNEGLLEGTLPLTPDREMPQDREELEKTIRRIVSEQPWFPISVLQALYDHWHPISNRPAPRRE